MYVFVCVFVHVFVCVCVRLCCACICCVCVHVGACMCDDIFIAHQGELEGSRLHKELMEKAKQFYTEAVLQDDW